MGGFISPAFRWLYGRVLGFVAPTKGDVYPAVFLSRPSAGFAETPTIGEFLSRSSE